MDLTEVLLNYSKTNVELNADPRIELRIYPVVDAEIVETISKAWLPMESLKNEGKFNPTFVKHIQRLSLKYVSWRRVRGDGNCYYRAVMCNYILKIFHCYLHKDRIFQLIGLLRSIEGEYPQEFIEAKEYFISYFIQHYNSRNNIEGSVESFTNVNLWLQDRDFDLNLVRMARLISLYTFRYKFDDYSAFMLDDEREILSRNLLKMGKEAEGLELLLLPLGLGICVKQINLFESLLETYYPTEEDGKNTDKVMITIICKKKGHYDMMYPVQDMEDEEYNIYEGVYHYYQSFVPPNLTLSSRQV